MAGIALKLFLLYAAIKTISPRTADDLIKGIIKLFKNGGRQDFDTPRVCGENKSLKDKHKSHDAYENNQRHTTKGAPNLKIP